MEALRDDWNCFGRNSLKKIKTYSWIAATVFALLKQTGNYLYNCVRLTGEVDS